MANQVSREPTYTLLYLIEVSRRNSRKSEKFKEESKHKMVDTIKVAKPLVQDHDNLTKAKNNLHDGARICATVAGDLDQMGAKAREFVDEYQEIRNNVSCVISALRCLEVGVYSQDWNVRRSEIMKVLLRMICGLKKISRMSHVCDAIASRLEGEIRAVEGCLDNAVRKGLCNDNLFD